MSYFDDFPYPDNPISDLITRQVRAIQEREFELVEKYCRLSLNDPQRRGVMIRRWGPDFGPMDYTGDDAVLSATNSMTVELDESVPWMTIHDRDMIGNIHHVAVEED